MGSYFLLLLFFWLQYVTFFVESSYCIFSSFLVSMQSYVSLCYLFLLFLLLMAVITLWSAQKAFAALFLLSYGTHHNDQVFLYCYCKRRWLFVWFYSSLELLLHMNRADQTLLLLYLYYLLWYYHLIIIFLCMRLLYYAWCLYFVLLLLE